MELTVVDLRSQLVLERLGADEPAFAQGTLVDFRNRMVRTDIERRLLLERTVAPRRSKTSLSSSASPDDRSLLPLPWVPKEPHPLG